MKTIKNKKHLPILLSLVLGASSMPLVGMSSATNHPAAIAPAEQPTLHVTVNGSNSFGPLHLAVGALAVSTAVLGYVVYKNGRALRRIAAQGAITNHNLMMAHAQTQQRFDQVDGKLATINNNIQTAHMHTTEQNTYTNANTAHMLQQINPQVQPLPGAPGARQLQNLAADNTPRVALQAVPEQSALDWALNTIDDGLNKGLTIMLRVPGMALGVMTATRDSMANPEHSFLYSLS